MAKGGSRETRKEAVVEIQVKENGSWNQSGRSVMVHLGIPLGVGTVSVGTPSRVAGCRCLRSRSIRDSIQFVTCNLCGIEWPTGAQPQMNTNCLRELTGRQRIIVCSPPSSFS